MQFFCISFYAKEFLLFLLFFSEFIGFLYCTRTLKITFLHLINLFIDLYGDGVGYANDHVHPTAMCGGQFSTSAVYVPKIKLRPWGLAVSTFALWAASVAHLYGILFCLFLLTVASLAWCFLCFSYRTVCWECSALWFRCSDFRLSAKGWLCLSYIWFFGRLGGWYNDDSFPSFWKIRN